MSAPGRNRTCDTRLRRALLYPLSYRGGSVGNMETVFPCIQAGFGLFRGCGTRCWKNLIAGGERSRLALARPC